MIRVTRLNGVEFWLNAELIEQIEKAPDTVITLTTGNNMIVKENVDTVIEKVLAYRGRVAAENERQKNLYLETSAAAQRCAGPKEQ